ncbi:MAG: phosphoenolpyruvate synthase, partial [Cyanobacteria bacterium REEB65]|nr:phosphoenolpyruvate synthase [Cyanobacteria bacterium REEB65]
MAYIAWFDAIGAADTPLVGGKGANLGEMLQAGLPVPGGFVVTTEAFRDFVTQTAVGDAIAATLAGLRSEDPVALQAAAEALERDVLTGPLPRSIAAAIVAAYDELPRRFPGGSGEAEQGVPVAVRSSAPVEDTAAFSF